MDDMGDDESWSARSMESIHVEDPSHERSEKTTKENDWNRWMWPFFFGESGEGERNRVFQDHHGEA